MKKSIILTGKKGVSITALVVTIIVTIILTGAVIAEFMDEKLIEHAKDAVMRSDYTTLRDCYDISYASELVKLEKGEKINITKVLTEAVKQAELEQDFSLADIVIYTGENTYIIEWLNELGIISVNKEHIELIKALTGAGYIYNIGYLTGIDINKENIENLLTNGYEFRKNENNGGTGYATGDIIVDSETDEIVATIMIYGDTDGANNIDGSDVTNILQVLNGTLKVEKNQLGIYDVNQDGYVTYADQFFLKNNLTEISGYEINQNKPYNTEIELITTKMLMEGIRQHSDVVSMELVKETIFDEEEGENIEVEQYVLTLSRDKSTEALKEMFMPYMKVIYSISGLNTVDINGLIVKIVND